MSTYAAYIEQTAQEIKKEIEDKKLVDDIPDFSEPYAVSSSAAALHGSFRIEPGENYSEFLRQSALHVQALKSGQVLFYRELSSYHRRFRGIVIFIKRVIRKLVKFLLEPMVEEINRDRELTVLALEQMQQYLGAHEAQSSEIQQILDELSRLQQQNELLRSRVELLSRQLRSGPQHKEE